MLLRRHAAGLGSGLTNRGTSQKESGRLREVRAALRRIEVGAFGMCVDCGESINPKRLAAEPWAAYCVVCQKATDRERAAPARWFDSAAVMAA